MTAPGANDPTSTRDGVSVVIPTFNEADAIAGVIRELPRDIVREVIVADGGSTDGTQDVARAAAAMVLDAGRGYGRACQVGAQAAAGPVVVFLDGDGADRGDLMDLIAGPVLAGTHDFVLASRTRGAARSGRDAVAPGAGRADRRLGHGRAVWRSLQRHVRVPRDRRDALRRLNMREMTYGWNIEMQMKAARAGLRIEEVPMPYRCRVGGQSKVAGSLRGTLRAGGKIVSTFVRVAVQPRV